MPKAFLQLARDTRGAMAVETAFILPILCIMALGGFETSMIVSRHYELQSAAGESEVIALAAASGATTDVEKVKAILKESVDLKDDQVIVEQFYRCNADEVTVYDTEDCNEDDVITSYIRLELKDR